MLEIVLPPVLHNYPCGDCLGPEHVPELLFEQTQVALVQISWTCLLDGMVLSCDLRSALQHFEQIFCDPSYLNIFIA